MLICVLERLKASMLTVTEIPNNEKDSSREGDLFQPDNGCEFVNAVIVEVTDTWKDFREFSRHPIKPCLVIVVVKASLFVSEIVKSLSSEEDLEKTIFAINNEIENLT